MHRFHSTTCLPHSQATHLAWERGSIHTSRANVFISAWPFNLQVDYIRAMVTEYLSQGLPPGLVTEATSQDPRSSLTSLTQLPRPPCPMNIAAMPLCEGRSGPGQSRTASRTSLPHLGGYMSRLQHFSLTFHPPLTVIFCRIAALTHTHTHTHTHPHTHPHTHTHT